MSKKTEKEKEMEKMLEIVFDFVDKLADEQVNVELMPATVAAVIQRISDALTIHPVALFMATSDLMLENKEVVCEQPSKEEEIEHSKIIDPTADIVAPRSAIVTGDGVEILAAPTPENYM